MASRAGGVPVAVVSPLMATSKAETFGILRDAGLLDQALATTHTCYEGDHPMPDTWECVAWKAKGGYGSQGAGAGRDNAKRERIWFSPACLRPQRSLFDTTPPAEQVG